MMKTRFSDHDKNEADTNNDIQTGGMLAEKTMLLLFNSDIEDEDLNTLWMLNLGLVHVIIVSDSLDSIGG